MKKRILKLAATHLRRREDLLEIRNGRVYDDNSNSYLTDIGGLIRDCGLKEISERAATEPSLPVDQERTSFTAHFAEVDVDVETGEISVDRYIVIQESGEIVNGLLLGVKSLAA